MATQEKFSATDRAGSLVPKMVEIGGFDFKVNRSGRALKNIIELQPEETPEGEESDGTENIEILYKGLSYVLVNYEEGPYNADPNGHPAPDWLMDELDFEVAQELMEKFVPRRAEGNEDSPAEPKIPSTPDTQATD